MKMAQHLFGIRAAGQRFFEQGLSFLEKFIKLRGAVRARSEALVMAFSDIFLILAVLFFAVIIFVPLAKRPAGKAAAAGH